jgi:uncharacterized membrane protein
VQKIVLFLGTACFGINFCIPLKKLGFFQEKIDFSGFFRLKAFFLVQFFIPGGDVNP